MADPAERLVAGITTALRAVRSSPALASWFAASEPPIGGEMAEQSEVINVLTAAFVNSLGPDDPAVVERRARWLVRVITSLLDVSRVATTPTRGRCCRTSWCRPW